jgi:hypothetical protein
VRGIELLEKCVEEVGIFLFLIWLEKGFVEKKTSDSLKRSKEHEGKSGNLVQVYQESRRKLNFKKKRKRTKK